LKSKPTFREKVYATVAQIPPGKVSTYRQIASMIRNPRAARVVGLALRALTTNEDNVPWWRVVNRAGYISINHGMLGAEKAQQKELLKSEGIEVNEKLVVELNKYLWYPKL